MQVAGRDHEWDAFMQIGTHSSTGSGSLLLGDLSDFSEFFAAHLGLSGAVWGLLVVAIELGTSGLPGDRNQLCS